jgi:ABC-type nitrate/sulfonate/bicarbonate transport system substrate-binding protein
MSMSKIKISFGTIRRNNHKTIYLIVLLLAGLVNPSFAQESSKKLLVAYSGLVSGNASLWIAEDLGLFKKHGLDVSAVFTGSGSVTSQALLAAKRNWPRTASAR